MNGQNNQSTHTIGYWLVLISLLGAVLLPPIQLRASLPKFEISDLIFPFLIMLTFVFYRNEIRNFFKSERSWLLGAGFFILIVIASILWNGRHLSLRDWFEPIKYVKLISFVFFFYLFIKAEQWFMVLKIIFSAVLLFNLLHYFNVLDFNGTVMKHYAAAHHLDFFGLNSIGEPATKRMIGTAGNPNNNAILFLAFVVAFLPGKLEQDRFKISFACLAILGVLACQSRTGFLALIVLMIVYFIVVRPGWKKFALLVLFTIVAFLSLQLLGNSYMGSVVDAAQLERAGVGRLEQWRRIIAAMPNHWFLGHGVNKDFMDERGIYAESEYFLVLFRYGIVGLLSFLSIWSFLFLRRMGQFKRRDGFLLLGILLIFAITSSTNAPMHSPKLALLFAMTTGTALILLKRERSH